MSSALKKSKLSDVNHFFCFLYKINISEIRGVFFKKNDSARNN